MLKRSVLFSLAILIVLSTNANAAAYKVDPNHSTVGFKIRHLFSNVTGRFDKFEGTIDYEPGKLATTFEAVTSNQLVVVSGMRVWSLCEHHLLPFWCDITIGYIPAGQVLGLSKFGRIAQQFAHRLQLQEQLTRQIAEAVGEAAGSWDVAVLGSGEHLCMTMRGVSKAGSRMMTSAVRGSLADSEVTRKEALSLIGKANG
jgi:GTP cyclohydrolase I